MRNCLKILCKYWIDITEITGNRTECLRVLFFTHGRFCLCCFSSV